MSGALRVPPGYRRLDRAAAVVLLRRELSGADADVLAGAPAWETVDSGAAPVSGRGAVARVPLPGGGAAIVKRMRRGGLVAGLWRDRYAGTRRLIANLEVADEARRRGVPTPLPLALRLREGPRGLHRGWLAVQEIEDAEDLRARLRRTPPPEDVEIGAALSAVRRMHDAGIVHRDLNLGNVMVRSGASGPEGWVLDLDRASGTDGSSLPAGPRLRALARLERSYVKEFGDREPLGPAPLDRWLDLYAAGRPDLAASLRALAPRRPRRRRMRRLWWWLRGEDRHGAHRA